jgi:hypothetical protein
MHTIDVVRAAVALMRDDERLRFATGSAQERRELCLIAIDRYWGAVRDVVSNAPDWPEASTCVGREAAISAIKSLQS